MAKRISKVAGIVAIALICALSCMLLGCSDTNKRSLTVPDGTTLTISVGGTLDELVGTSLVLTFTEEGETKTFTGITEMRENHVSISWSGASQRIKDMQDNEDYQPKVRFSYGGCVCVVNYTIS